MTEKQFAISELLRNADKEIKGGKLEVAMRYINSVFELDQRNVYAKAYKERLLSLMEAQGILRADAERILAEAKPMPATPPSSPASPEKLTPAPPPPPPVREKDSKKPAASKDNQKAAHHDAIPAATTEAHRPAPAEKAAPPPPRAAPPPVQTVSTKEPYTIKRTAAAQEAYRSLLLEIWKDGKVSAEEQLHIDSMRDTFAISQDEHAAIEREVRITAYLNAIRDAWKKGVTNFESVRERFTISDQDQITLEPKVMQLLQSLQSNGSVLVLDDDTSFLDVIRDVLNEGGYYAFTAVSGEEALQLLETMTPDIVICDINFQKPHMSGFAFYERFRSMDAYLTTPFIFLSALDQDVLVRTGKKLGADDYLTKPVDAEMLIATIEGKLRRSRELRRSFE